jgi:predicted transcriptional regulator
MGVVMKSLTVRQLDEKDEEIADALISLGMSRNVARILSFLQNKKEVTSVELEREAGLRQPEVSLAIRGLKGHGWINEREEKKPGKGRPYKVYSLKVGFDEIVDELEKQQRKAADEMRLRIERLRKSRRY